MRVCAFFVRDGEVQKEKRDYKSLKAVKSHFLWWAKYKEQEDSELEVRIFAPPLARFIKDPDPNGDDAFYFIGILRLRQGQKKSIIVFEPSERRKKKLI
jgi:hypothetical protein